MVITINLKSATTQIRPVKIRRPSGWDNQCVRVWVAVTIRWSETIATLFSSRHNFLRPGAPFPIPRSTPFAKEKRGRLPTNITQCYFHGSWKTSPQKSQIYSPSRAEIRAIASLAPALRHRDGQSNQKHCGSQSKRKRGTLAPARFNPKRKTNLKKQASRPAQRSTRGIPKKKPAARPGRAGRWK